MFGSMLIPHTPHKLINKGLRFAQQKSLKDLIQYYGIAVLTGCMMLSIFMVFSDIFLLLAQIQSVSFCFPDGV